jgi:hypothetical protein
VGSFVNLCNVTTLIPPASHACCDVHEALGGAFSKRHHVDCGVIAIICEVPIWGLMRHSVDGFSPSSWESQEEGMMSTIANFPSVRNQGLSVQEKAKLKKVMLASLVTLQQGRR